ncbi:MAG TPA: nitronate monooxygenase [Thermodesulfobacteriota bacterium]|nr:nitronate monooxygenase [Thermodesulfobacteriota bacterium]
MKKTRICTLLRIDYPILQGGMLWLATADLAAAVSNAGALGVISPYAGMEKHGDPSENLRLQVARARILTKKPFGINIPLDLDQSGMLIDAILKEKVGIVVTAAGDPHHYTGVLRKEGIKVLHVVSTAEQAQLAESCKVDAVIAEGVEAGGHLGFDEIPLFSLIPQVADVVSIPIIATGGISDARGVVAAFALGAEGVQLGTRFVAVKENIAHSRYKQAILNAGDTDTAITCRKLLPARSLKTEFTRRLLELEDSGASAGDIRNFLGYSRARTGQIEGDLENGEAYSGASAGLIKEVLPAAEVVQELIEGYQKVIKKIT